MPRPSEPLIHKDAAIAAALDIIDEEGIEALSIRRLGTILGVNGASLYHHFRNKEAILAGVRQLVLSDLVVPDDPDADEINWRDFALDVCVRYRKDLTRHPNTSPLMLHLYPRTMGLDVYNFICQLMLEQGVPDDLIYPILDSLETLAFGAAMMKPQPTGSGKGFPRLGSRFPALRRAISKDVRTADQRFELAARSLLAGWDAEIAVRRSATAIGKGRKSRKTTANGPAQGAPRRLAR